MVWTRKTLTETSGWFNQKPLAPLDETLRLPIALEEIFSQTRKEYKIVLKKKPLIVHNGYFYLRSYLDYFSQLIFQPRAFLLLSWRLIRETKKAKDEWRRRVKRFLEELNQLKHQDLSKLNNKELLEHIKKTIEFDAYWIFKLGGGLHVVYHQFSEILLKFLYRLLVKDKYPQNYHELLIGYPNKLKEADLAFWEVVRGKLNLDNYLEKYGFRASDVSLAIPTIGEDRKLFQRRINSFRNTAIPDFEKINKEVLEKRRRREKYVSENFRSWILFGRVIFNKVLRIAKDYIPVRETRRFYYTMGTFWVRKSLLKLGKRLNFLKDPEDIFFLTKNELEKAVLKLKQLDGQQIVTKIVKRKRQWEIWSKQAPPENIEL